MRLCVPSSSGEAAAYSRGDAPRSSGCPTRGLSVLTNAPMGLVLSVLSNSGVLVMPAAHRPPQRHTA